MPSADDSLAMLKEIPIELRDHRTLLLLVHALRRRDRRFGDLERRLNDLGGESELMLKGELMGRLTHFETHADEKLAQLSDRLHAVESAE